MFFVVTGQQSKAVERMKSELLRLKRAMCDAGNRLGAPERYVHLHTMPQNDGSYHVEYDGSIYHYVSTERGNEVSRRSTHSFDEMLFWLVAQLTKEMAMAECSNRRSRYFKRHVEYLRELSDQWAERQTEEYESILAKHPLRQDEEGQGGND